MKRSLSVSLFAAGSLLFLIGALFAFLFPEYSPDRALSAYFAEEPLPQLTPAITLLTRLNSPPAVLLYLLLLSARLFSRGKRRETLFVWTAIGGTALINSLLKSLIARPRPELRLVEIHTPSFPSWHSSTSMALALSLWFLFVRNLPPDRRNALGGLLLLWPLLIGFSRLFLNAHWFSDILAGWGLGMLLTSLGTPLLSRPEKNHAAA